MRSISTICLLIILFVSNKMIAQKSTEARIGETFKIAQMDESRFSHLNLPRANFIIKEGGIADYSKLAGTQVTVTEVRTNSRNETKVILKRKDGKKFFGSFPEIKADYKKALSSGQLRSI